MYTSFVNVNPEYNTNVLRFAYASMTTPSSIYDFNMDTQQRELKKQTEVLGGFKKEEYTSERVWATARDGAKVPISLVYKKGMNKDGSNPLAALCLRFLWIQHQSGLQQQRDQPARSWIHLCHRACARRTGNGPPVVRPRPPASKRRIPSSISSIVAEFLIKEKYTVKEHLYANGGSAGGLLMGAITNLRPDLWHGVVADVPFVDVITTMSDPTIPLTTGEYEEWGNPADSAEYFYMKSYSPYDNVERKHIPTCWLLPACTIRRYNTLSRPNG